MLRGCSASASTFCPSSGRWAESKRTGQSRPCTAFASSGSSLFFLASSAPTCPLVSPRSPPTATWQPGCWLCWRFSLYGYVRFLGCSSSPSISSERPISSSTITTLSRSAFLRSQQVHLPRAPCLRLIAARRWPPPTTPLAGYRLRHRRPGALSCRHFRLSGDRRRPEPWLHRCGHLPDGALRTVQSRHVQGGHG